MGFLNRIFTYEYITKEHLTGFDKYKYSCVDSSPLSKYVMHPFWNTIVNFYPRWLAPNILTFTGFLCLIVNFILFSIYDYSFYGYCFNRDDCLSQNSANLTSRQIYFQENLSSFSQVPLHVCSCMASWLWFVAGICQFLSHHLDGTDGKQARRTQSSTPLGELFDHGLDSWAALLLPVALYSIFGRSELYGISTFRMYRLLWLILGSFIISHWEKYNTGILFLPWSYDLSQIGMTILFLLTSIFGQQVWYFNVGDWTSTQIIEIFIYVFSLGLSLPFSIYNMYQAYLNKTFKQPSVYEAIRPLFATFYLFIIQCIWLSYSRINIIELEPRMFYWITGTLFSNISCRLIVAQMTSTRCEIFNWALIPLTAVVTLFTCPYIYSLNSSINKDLEIIMIYIMALVVTLEHIHYGFCMVRQICNHLNIYCFVITSKPPPNIKKVE